MIGNNLSNFQKGKVTVHEYSQIGMSLTFIGTQRTGKTQRTPINKAFYPASSPSSVVKNSSPLECAIQLSNIE